MTFITLYTDGAYCRATNTGGWCYFLKAPKAEKLVYDKVTDPPVSTPRMELLAAVLGLEAISKPSSVTVISDATYVVHPITEEKGYGVKEMTSPQTRPNVDLWQRLHNMQQFHIEITAKHVKSHSGDRHNDLTDEMAKKQAGTWTKAAQRQKDKRVLQKLEKRQTKTRTPKQEG